MRDGTTNESLALMKKAYKQSNFWWLNPGSWLEHQAGYKVGLYRAQLKACIDWCDAGEGGTPEQYMKSLLPSRSSQSNKRKVLSSTAANALDQYLRNLNSNRGAAVFHGDCLANAAWLDMALGGCQQSVAVDNLANATFNGGGVHIGAAAQEEHISRALPRVIAAAKHCDNVNFITGWQYSDEASHEIVNDGHAHTLPMEFGGAQSTLTEVVVAGPDYKTTFFGRLIFAGFNNKSIQGYQPVDRALFSLTLVNSLLTIGAATTMGVLFVQGLLPLWAIITLASCVSVLFGLSVLCVQQLMSSEKKANKQNESILNEYAKKSIQNQYNHGSNSDVQVHGALSCGAFGGDASKIADLYQASIQDNRSGKQIRVFSIMDGAKTTNCAQFREKLFDNEAQNGFIDAAIDDMEALITSDQNIISDAHLLRLTGYVRLLRAVTEQNTRGKVTTSSSYLENKKRVMLSKYGKKIQQAVDKRVVSLCAAIADSHTDDKARSQHVETLYSLSTLMEDLYAEPYLPPAELSPEEHSGVLQAYSRLRGTQVYLHRGIKKKLQAFFPKPVNKSGEDVATVVLSKDSGRKDVVPSKRSTKVEQVVSTDETLRDSHHESKGSQP